MMSFSKYESSVSGDMNHLYCTLKERGACVCETPLNVAKIYLSKNTIFDADLFMFLYCIIYFAFLLIDLNITLLSIVVTARI